MFLTLLARKKLKLFQRPTSLTSNVGVGSVLRRIARLPSTLHTAMVIGKTLTPTSQNVVLVSLVSVAFLQHFDFWATLIVRLLHVLLSWAPTTRRSTKVPRK